MRRIFVCLLITIHAIIAVSQNSPEDETAAIDSILELSFQSYAYMDINSSLSHALDARAMSEKINYSKGKARGNFYIAQVMANLGEYEKALDYLFLAEQEPFVATELILPSEICRVRGRTYGSLQLYDMAVTEFHKGLEYVNQINTTFEREYLTSLAYDNLSHTYFLQKKVDSAMHYLNLNNLLLTATSEERLFRSRINLYAQLGKAHTRKGEYDEATNYFVQALKLAEEYEYPYTSWIYLQWGNMMSQQEQSDSALVKYYLALENLQQTNLRSELPDIYTSLRDEYIQLGVTDSALLYHQKKIDIEEELAVMNLKVLDKAVSLLLRKEKDVQSSRLAYSRWIVIGGISFVGLFALGVWIRWRRRYKKAKEKEMELKRVIKEKRRSALDEVIELARENDITFLPRFMELFPNFTNNFYRRHPNMSKSSFMFCAYIFLHFSSKEIAECMYVEHKSVQTRKNRLRKQLDLPPNTDLYQYMRWLDKPEDYLTAHLAGDVLMHSGN